ncbi:MAG: exonuclease domain-containing protein [Pseudomonadota bacterium]
MALSEVGPEEEGVIRRIERWPLRLRIFLFFALLALGGAALIGGAAWFGYSRLDSAAPGAAFVLTAITGGFALVALTVWIWLLFDENVAKPVLSLASDLRARAHADLDSALDHEAARYLGDLAPAAAAVARGLAESRSELGAAIEREQARLLTERARLEAALRDAPAACLLLTHDHRIALYNKQALDQLDAGGEGLSALGLGRSVFELFDPEPIRDAAERLDRREDGAAVDLICATRHGERVFHGRMRQLVDPARAETAEPARPSHVLMLRDVTAELADHAETANLLTDVFDQIRRPAANLLTTIEALRTPECAEQERRVKLQAAVVSETRRLADSITDLAARYEAGSWRRWPQIDAPASDLLRSAETRLAAEGLTVSLEPSPLTLRCDGFAIARLIGDLALKIAERGDAADFALAVAADAAPLSAPGGATLDLSWRGAPLNIGALDAWLDAPLGGGYVGLTLRDTLEAHKSDVWPEPLGDGRYCLRLPLSLAENAASLSAARSSYADLDLLSGLSHDRLTACNFVVFDTETTGLAPNNGDEIVQIAAVRIVNNRVLQDDRFDMLVDPERPIPASSTAIHGVTEEMVAGAPTIAEAGRRFHAFCGGAALIAHNANFDMAFLRRHEPRIERRFDQPVLDTVLLSAALWGKTAPHSLDALAERLDVTIPPEARHTAIGDTLATAEAAVKMMAMLEGRGVRSWDELEAAIAPYRDIVANGANL